ncbi:NIPSNAP family protein [Amycolatopsis sp. K13G38]|uniref:NIPSNAP family protein n=1 Tax=Amycolatopsis acididurans TaxID=2724524 RepID=A0ABX1J6W1_9PSEU|nr:NIPSNAP family protein [Amycolatopsis acididurans]NKQ55498.1 NIPSNAP family protein [Amycolatopsis acididurans]
MDQPAPISGENVGQQERDLRYELATLSFPLLEGEKASAGVLPWVNAPEARGQLLGCWQTENGPLGRLVVLRVFVNDAELARERQRARASSEPFGAGEHLTDLTLQSFAPFPFVPPVRTGRFGPVYEIRDYHLRPGGLPATIHGWRQALPARHRIDPLTIVMYALDGPDRIIQIWPFQSLDERVALRRDLYGSGLWPPPGAPEQILDATSIIAWPAGFSPLT